MDMENDEVLSVVRSVKLGDKLAINDWRAKYTVCGLSAHFILAHYGRHYTIIERNPVPEGYRCNGVRGGDIRCAPDYWIFGYGEGYFFTDEAWVTQYMIDLESGFTQLSERNQAPVWFIFVVGHTDSVYADKNAIKKPPKGFVGD